MKKLEKLFDILGEILAVVMVLVYAVWILNTSFHFMDSIPMLVNVVEFLRAWGSWILIAIVSLECACKWPVFFQVIFYLIVALVVVFMFFPATYDAIIGSIPVA